MNIETHSIEPGKAKGIVVIIDVLRACTTLPILFKQGMREVVPVVEIEEAEEFRKHGYVLIGEGDHGSQHDIFHYNNSPTDVLGVDFTGKSGVLRSNNATRAIHLAEQATDIIMGSFLNIRAIVDYINAHHLQEVTLVALGRLNTVGIEDELCAQVIDHELRGESYDFDAIAEDVRTSPTAELVRGKLARPQDVEIAVQLNAYPCVPRVITENGRKIIRVV